MDLDIWVQWCPTLTSKTTLNNAKNHVSSARVATEFPFTTVAFLLCVSGKSDNEMLEEKDGSESVYCSYSGTKFDPQHGSGWLTTARSLSSRAFDIFLPPWALAFLYVYVHIDNLPAYRTKCAHNLK